MKTKTQTFRTNTLLLLTAAIWGSGFIAQRAGMDHVGPFTFNAFRFFLGSLALIPVIYVTRKGRKQYGKVPLKTIIQGGALAGIAVFLGSTFQQTGIVYTTAGKAGFITGLYVILVPILGIFLRHKAGIGTWIGAVSAIIGLCLLSFTGDFTSATLGDLLVLIGAFFWAAHVHILGWYSPRMDTILLAFIQFIACSILSFCMIPIFSESIQIQAVTGAAWPICYSGFISVGIAYTLQVVAQKDAHPSHAAIVLSLEAVFAVIFGVLILHESLTVRGFLGCVFMFSGMIFSQMYGVKQSRNV